jgi:hypothetical protein
MARRNFSDQTAGGIITMRHVNRISSFVLAIVAEAVASCERLLEQLGRGPQTIPVTLSARIRKVSMR